MAYTLTNHSTARMEQRGVREADVDLLVRFGTVTKNGVLMLRKDVDSRIHELKHEMKALERLAGTFVVMKDDHVVTVYRATKKQRREQVI